MIEKKSNFLLPAIAATVIIAGAAGAIYYVNNSKSATSGNILGNAKLIPSQALMAISITTDQSAWTQLEQFQTPETRKLFDDNFKKLQTQILVNNPDINFDQDIKPWAGSVMFAILPPTKSTTQSQQPLSLGYLPTSYKVAQTEPSITPEPSESNKPSKVPVTPPTLKAPVAAPEPNILLVVEIKDKGNAAKFADKVKAKAGGKLEQQEYKGVQITQFKNDAGRTMNTALLGDYLVVSPQDKALKNAIDTSKGDSSFATSINPSELDLKNPLVQFFMPKFADSVQQLVALNSDAADIPPQSLDQLKQIKSVVMGIGVDTDGLRLKGLTKLDPATFKAEYKTAPGKVISLFPSETVALLTGSDIKTRWNQFTSDADKNPDLKKNLEEARQFYKKEPFNIDIDKDIFSWMDGEFAIAMLSTKEGSLAQYGVLPAFVFQTSNRAIAEATLKKLETIAQGNAIKVNKRDIKGTSITEWVTPKVPDAVLGYGWNQSNSLVIGFGNLAGTLASKPTNSLDTNSTFKSVTDSLAKTNIGYFYLDMDKTWSLIGNQIPPEEKSKITPEATALINSIRGIGVTAVMPEKTTSKFELLLALKPKGTK